MPSFAPIGIWLVDRKIFLLILGACVWIAWGISLFLGTGHFDAAGQMVGVDHLAFYSTAKLHAAERIEEIYDLESLGRFQNEIAGPGWNSLEAFRAPPFSMIPYRLTSGLSYLTSFWIWTLFSIIALIACIFKVCREEFRFAITWSLTFYPVFATISFGQNSLISLGIFTTIYLFLKSNRPHAAGLLASLLFFKPQLLIGVLLWWLIQVRRDSRPLFGLALGAGLLTCFTLTALGPESEQYLSNLKILLRYDQFDFWNMHNGRAFIALLLDLSAGTSRTLGMLILLFGAAGWVVLSTREDESKLTNIDLNMSRAIVFTLLFSPHTMIYEWVIVLLPVAVMLNSSLKHDQRFVAMCLIADLALFFSTPISKGMSKVSPYALQISVPIIAWVAWTWLVRNTDWSRTNKNTEHSSN